MRILTENSNIIKIFMTRGPISFYLPYYLKGDEFIKQIHIPNKEVREVADIARVYLENKMADLEDDEIDMEGVVAYCQHIVLTGLLDIKKHKPTEKELKLYQYIADIIVGQANIMLGMVADATENDEIDEETIEIAESNVYNAILELFINIDRQAKFADETEVC